MARTVGAAGPGWAAPLRSEGGFAMVGALLVSAVTTALGVAALFLSQLDLTLAGNYRVQRSAEVAADGALELTKAMIYGNAATLNLPLGIPAGNTSVGWSQSATYADADIDVTVTLRYKQEDNINFNTAENYSDEVVRYGRDYNYQEAQKALGKQPVYVVTFRDNRTGARGEADLISTIGFRTPGAIFCAGRVHMQKYQWATEESIEVTSGFGTPAVATASNNAGDINIETVRESTTFTGTTKLTANLAAGSTSIAVASTAPFGSSGQVLVGGAVVRYTGKDATHFLGCTPADVPSAPAGTFVNVTSGTGSYTAVNPNATNNYALNPSYLHPRVYRPSEVQASRAAGLYNQARDSAHILLGVGDRYANLDAAYAAAGGGSGGAAAANALYRFYNATADGLGGYDAPVAFDNSGSTPTCTGVACYDYVMPNAQGSLTQLETMFGQSFADLKSLADQEFTCTSTVSLPTGGSSSTGCNLSGVNLGSAAAPRVVYFNGNGTNNPISLVTDAGTQVSGFGILVIDDDADIVGSINWTGLMLIKGNLVFRPWQGGSNTTRSGPELSTRWNGFIIVGGALDLWTYWGGSIILGYSTSEVAAIKGIIASTVPHKVLAWRRTYN